MSMNVVRLSVVMGASAMLAVLAGCSKKEAAAPAAPEPAAKSILDLMHDPIASNADLLWNAVGTVSTETGTKDLAPSTDAEWAALRKQALAIAEAAKLLPMEGRVVAHPDQKLKDPPARAISRPPRRRPPSRRIARLSRPLLSCWRIPPTPSLRPSTRRISRPMQPLAARWMKCARPATRVTGIRTRPSHPGFDQPSIFQSLSSL